VSRALDGRGGAVPLRHPAQSHSGVYRSLGAPHKRGDTTTYNGGNGRREDDFCILENTHTFPIGLFVFQVHAILSSHTHRNIQTVGFMIECIQYILGNENSARQPTDTEHPTSKGKTTGPGAPPLHAPPLFLSPAGEWASVAKRAARWLMRKARATKTGDSADRSVGGRGPGPDRIGMDRPP